MFSVHTITEAGFEKLVLKDTGNNTSVVIIPSCGAILHAFTVQHNGQYLNIVDGYNSKSDFEEQVTAKGFKSCKLSPFACRIKNAVYTFEGKPYTIEKFLLNGSALHGLIYDVAFTVKEAQAGEDSAVVILMYSYKGSDKGYPFNYDCEVRYELKKNNALTLTTTVTNQHHHAIPMQDGWHPYFSFGGSINELQLCFQGDSMVEFDEALIPTGKLLPYNDFLSFKHIGTTSFDNCFVLKAGAQQPLCVLRDVKQQLQLEIRPGNSYPYLQIYTPSHRNSIAIENLSAAPDVFNNNMGLIILQPESSVHFTTTYQITSLIKG
jgi:aldose 1-epimerase